MKTQAFFQNFLKSRRRKDFKASGFTIVELLVVIIVIALLATIVIVAYTGIRQQAAESKRDADLNSLKHAIVLARAKSGKTLAEITDSTYSLWNCFPGSGNNPDDDEPKDLPTSSPCWQAYYGDLDAIGDAANVDLGDLESGDAYGNPYFINEDEGETAGDPCHHDDLGYFTGSGTDYYGEYIEVPLSLPECL